MPIIKRRPRRSKDFLDDRKFFRQNKFHANSEQNASPWKIISMLIFLTILVVLLLQNDEPEDNEPLNKRNIPDPESPLPPSLSQLYTFRHAAISSDSQACSDLARDLLRERNGTIFDASISALICNGLTNIQSTGLLGGFLLTAHIPSENKSIIIDAQMTAPKNFILPHENFDIVKHGGSAIAVPGFLHGILEIHKNYSKLPFKDILQPIIDLCKNGIILTKHLRDSIEFNDRIINDLYLRDLFIEKSTGKIKRIGSRIILSKHCRFLEFLISENQDIFKGKIGAMIEADLKAVNSILTLDDLKSYKVKTYNAKSIDITNNYSVLVPNSLALLIPSILKILMKFNFNETSWLIDEYHINNTILTHHRIIETFKHVFAMREHFGDPDFKDIENITAYLLSDDFADTIVKSINDSFVKTNIEEYGLKEIVPQNHGTSHISIATREDAISVTSSINYYFGAGISGNESGLIFNNGMDDFSYPDRSINYFGLKETANNYPVPGKRALSSIAPTIMINKKANEFMVIGAAGGSKIISSLSLAILRFLCCSNDIKEIVDAPRFHHQLIPNVMEYEYGTVSNVIEGLIMKGHATHRYRNRGTIINALTIDDRYIYAISDYRKDFSGVSGF